MRNGEVVKTNIFPAPVGYMCQYEINPNYVSKSKM